MVESLKDIPRRSRGSSAPVKGLVDCIPGAARRLEIPAAANAAARVGCVKIRHWNSAAADLSVIQTPQASGTPTKAQRTAAFQSKPPLPIPNEPDAESAALLAPAAWSFKTSSSLMYHFGFTGLTRKLQIKPMISIPHRIYMVKS